MSKYLDKAKEIRAIVEPHHNCAQSVIESFNEESDVSNELAYRIGSCFGAGMKSGGTCGVVTGALMTLGIFGVDDPDITRKMVNYIRDNHEGMLMCTDLLRKNAERGGEKKPHCDAMVYEAVEFVEKILREQGKIK